MSLSFFIIILSKRQLYFSDVNRVTLKPQLGPLLGSPCIVENSFRNSDMTIIIILLFVILVLYLLLYRLEFFCRKLIYVVFSF